MLKPRIQVLAESSPWTTEETMPELEERNRLECFDRGGGAKERDAIRKRVAKKAITQKEAAETR